VEAQAANVNNQQWLLIMACQVALVVEELPTQLLLLAELQELFRVVLETLQRFFHLREIMVEPLAMKLVAVEVVVRLPLEAMQPQGLELLVEQELVIL
jgi:hypothetical protein